MWDWEEAAWVNLKQRDKEKKENVGDGKYPRREKGPGSCRESHVDVRLA